MQAQDVIYTGYFVDNPTELLKQFPPKHENVYAHHSTNVFKPTSLDNFQVGQKTKLKIIGRISDEQGDALLVENPKSGNIHPHITLSCVQGVAPVYANTLIQNATPEQKEMFTEPFYVDVTEGCVLKKGDVILS